MDEETIKNLHILEECGYFYEECSQSFWDAEHETYIELSLSNCNDMVRVMNAIISHEKKLAYHDGEYHVRSQIKNALGIKN